MQVSKNVSWRWRPALSVLVALVYCTSLPAQASQDDMILPETVYAVTSFSLPRVFPSVAEQAININFKVLTKNLSATPAVRAIMAADKHKKIAAHKVALRKVASHKKVESHKKMASRKKVSGYKKFASHRHTKSIIAHAKSHPAIMAQAKAPSDLAPVKGWLDDPKNLQPTTRVSAKEPEKKIELQKTVSDTLVHTTVTGWLDDPKKLTPSVPTVATLKPQPVEASLPITPTGQKVASITNVSVQPQSGPDVVDLSSPKQDKMAAIQFGPKLIQSNDVAKTVVPPAPKADIVAVVEKPKAPVAQKEQKPQAEEVHLSTAQNEENKTKEPPIAAPVVPVKESLLTKNSDSQIIASLEHNPNLITMATPFVPITSATDQPVSSVNPTMQAQQLLPLPIPNAQPAQTTPSAPVITSQPMPIMVTPSSQAITTAPSSATAAQPLPIPLQKNAQPVTPQAAIPVSMPTQPPAAMGTVPALSAAPQTSTNQDAPLPVSPVMKNALSKNSSQLSEQTKRIVRKLPPEKPAVDEADNPNPVVMDHARKNEMEEDVDVKKHEGVGIKITVERPKLNITRMLENAYNDLVEGDQQDAIDIYQQVLKEQPHNTLALFGLATTYHRAGQIELARPLYGKLLAIDPQNKEGLNNFLVLIADESPQAAITELEKLQRTHPEFSPIPAQLAIIHEKLGEYRKAAECMESAIALSPANLKYRYDMAVILDKGGFRAEAIDFYQQLVNAYLRGEKIPANIQNIQERLTFIRSNKQGM